jgi:hypothetical protein
MLVRIQFPECRFTLLWLEVPQESAQVLVVKVIIDRTIAANYSRMIKLSK